VTERGGLWHTLGWPDERTILTSYQQADAATVKQVVLSPTQRLLGT